MPRQAHGPTVRKGQADGTPGAPGAAEARCGGVGRPATPRRRPLCLRVPRGPRRQRRERPVHAAAHLPEPDTRQLLHHGRHFSPAGGARMLQGEGRGAAGRPMVGTGEGRRCGRPHPSPEVRAASAAHGGCQPGPLPTPPGGSMSTVRVWPLGGVSAGPSAGPVPPAALVAGVAPGAAGCVAAVGGSRGPASSSAARRAPRARHGHSTHHTRALDSGRTTPGLRSLRQGAGGGHSAAHRKSALLEARGCAGQKSGRRAVSHATSPLPKQSGAARRALRRERHLDHPGAPAMADACAIRGPAPR
jgi:hypothetical protein